MVIDEANTLMAFTFPDGSGITLLSYFDLHFKVLTAKEIKAIRKAPHMTDEQIETISAVCRRAPREDVEKILRGEVVKDGRDAGPVKKYTLEELKTMGAPFQQARIFVSLKERKAKISFRVAGNETMSTTVEILIGNTLTASEIGEEIAGQAWAGGLITEGTQIEIFDRDTLCRPPAPTLAQLDEAVESAYKKGRVVKALNAAGEPLFRDGKQVWAAFDNATEAERAFYQKETAEPADLAQLRAIAENRYPSMRNRRRGDR
jgi:hypothetical protein